MDRPVSGLRVTDVDAPSTTHPGNHVVIRRDDGACVVVAHLKRNSVRVARGDRVDRGALIAACGNSGNSTEPHVHVQAMDWPALWLAEGRPLLIDGRQPPRDGEVLNVVPDRRGQGVNGRS